MTQLPTDIARAADYLRHAERVLDAGIWGWLSGGAGSESTLRANRDALDDLKIYNRLLVDVSSGHTGLSLFGQGFAHPILLAPIGYQKLLAPDGELATAQGADATDTAIVLSTLSSTEMENVTAQSRAPKWFQLYLQPRAADTEALVSRALAAEYSAIVVTLDTPVQALVPRAQRAGFAVPESVKAVHLESFAALPQRQLTEGDSVVFLGAMNDAPRYAELENIISRSNVPVLVKGVSHPDDAARLIEVGVAGLVVSNHGGRSLDGLPAAISLLPTIRARVGEDVPLLVDGGIESGADVFRALASGADAVMVGRLQGAALAVAGALGVAHMLKLLREEFELTMALAGCATLKDIGTHNLVPAG